jgi:hypothetical protein
MKHAISTTHSATHAARSAVLTALGALTLAMLAGCSKPPGCADSKVTELAKQIIEENVVKKADPSGLSRMQVGLSLITEEGYNSEVGKWACSAQVTLQTRSEVLKAVNDEMGLIRTAINFLGVAAKQSLNEEEKDLVRALEARGWKPYTQDNLKAPVTFSSQYEAGSKNLVVGVNGAAGLNQFPQLTRLAFERQQREAKAQGSSGKPSSQPTPAAAVDQPTKIQVSKAEMCGAEALCITDATGATYTGNAFAIADGDRAYILEAAKRQGTVCLKGVAPDKTFESAEKC